MGKRIILKYKLCDLLRNLNSKPPKSDTGSLGGPFTLKNGRQTQIIHCTYTQTNEISTLSHRKLKYLRRRRRALLCCRRPPLRWS